MYQSIGKIPAPEVSICLPAYKHQELLQRCLNSVAQQTSANFEVIVTDDSPDDTIEKFIQEAGYSFPLQYYRNIPALGSPANWNAAIKKAKGKYIKMMHHDDWFANPSALETFCKALDSHPESLFAFSISRDFIDGKGQALRCDFNRELQVWKKDRSHLVTYNFIGDPSTIIFRNNTGLLYDERMKWCVDTDFNLQLYENNSNIIFIDEELVHIGTHPGQVTHTVQHDAKVVVYENILLLNKHQVTKLSLKQFDYYWRMLRNFKVKGVPALQQLGKEQPLPQPIKTIALVQGRIPYRVLKIGPASKLLMVISYLFFQKR